MKGINTPGQALDPGGKASSWAPRGGVSHLTFPALAREWNQHTASAPLASLGNEKGHPFAADVQGKLIRESRINVFQVP